MTLTLLTVFISAIMKYLPPKKSLVISLLFSP